MKKVMILLILTGVFTGCSNDKSVKDKYNRDKSQDETRAKDDYLSNDKNSDSKANAGNKNGSVADDNNNLRTKTSKDGWGDKENTQGWSESDENKFMNDCERTAKKNVSAARANQYCDCMLQKLSKIYPSYSEADRDQSSNATIRMDKLADGCNEQ